MPRDEWKRVRAIPGSYEEQQRREAERDKRADQWLERPQDKPEKKRKRRRRKKGR